MDGKPWLKQGYSPCKGVPVHQDSLKCIKRASLDQSLYYNQSRQCWCTIRCAEYIITPLWKNQVQHRLPCSAFAPNLACWLARHKVDDVSPQSMSVCPAVFYQASSPRKCQISSCRCHNNSFRHQLSSISGTSAAVTSSLSMSTSLNVSVVVPCSQIPINSLVLLDEHMNNPALCCVFLCTFRFPNNCCLLQPMTTQACLDLYGGTNSLHHLYCSSDIPASYLSFFLNQSHWMCPTHWCPSTSQQMCRECITCWQSSNRH
jgi:hypothetical protein